MNTKTVPPYSLRDLLDGSSSTLLMNRTKMPNTSSGDPIAAASPYCGGICWVAVNMSVVTTLMFWLRPRRRGAVNCPRPSRSAMPAPYTSDGRRSGRVMRKKTAVRDEPLTCAASINSPLICSSPELTKR